MRICHIINLGFEAGGAEKIVRLLSDGFRARGHEIMIVSTDHLLAGEPCMADVVVPAITGNAPSRLAKFFWHHKAFVQVRAAVEAFKPDVVHLHTIGLFSPAVLAATARWPQVVTVQGPEDWTLELLSWNLASRSVGDGRLTLGDRARYLYLRFLERPVYLPLIRRVDRVLVPSRYFGKAVRRDVPRVPTFLVPNGIELLTRQPMSDTGEVLYVGRLESIKGITVLVQAFADVVRRRPHARLTLIGRGSQKDEIDALVDQLGLRECVDVLGFVSEAELVEAYRRAMVVVMPSICPDNFPTVALEALGVGRAMIGTRVGGIPELVKDEENGLLVPPGDVDALTEAIDRILGDRELAARMGERSAAAAGQYSVEVFLDRMETHYQQAIDDREARRSTNARHQPPVAKP